MNIFLDHLINALTLIAIGTTLAYAVVNTI
jgi:hypothetical protein